MVYRKSLTTYMRADEAHEVTLPNGNRVKMTWDEKQQEVIMNFGWPVNVRITPTQSNELRIKVEDR